ncbi:M14 family metallopeptidase [Blastopirellula retiformator]|uniref:Zinc carboxypeptidase n=1 Tax=Blastopirellula retiformator TaxID=2527970 RepID=A0A5C5V8R8_9BACT|nr:M14 metallopeptidase family protein [Blastopirellula retiformator]TWT34420.1 Zinc carboxypeptidase [Blastopirellula retiformator]
MLKVFRSLLWFGVLISTGLAHAAPPMAESGASSPEQFLERSVGADYCLVDWSTVEAYYRQLAEKTSTVAWSSVGESTEGRDFSAVVISSTDNLENLATIQEYSRTIADPRGKTPEQIEEAIAQGKVVLVITPTMHSDEPAATEMAMQLSWTLATSEEEPWRSMRQEAVTVILPSLNPDGLDHVAQWYAKNLGKPYEDASLPELYQRYVGHDNNRDFFALTQVESQLLSKLMYEQWNPQILWDVHQHGKTGVRFFVPPYCDPLNVNIDPLMVAAVNAIGSRAVLDMTTEGCTGIATGVNYDNWWNGGNRSVPARLNIVGILTEAASVNYASPVFLKASQLQDPLGRGDYRPSNQFIAPWPGGWWRQADIIRYELEFAKSLCGSICREPKLWLRQKVAAAKRAATLDDQSARIAWLVTVDNEDLGAVERLTQVLKSSGVEIHQSKTIISADGRQYAPGTLVIRCDQPHSRLVNDLFEWKKFPKNESAYDVSGWSLPTLFGVRVVEVVHDLSGEFTLFQKESLPAGFAGPSDSPLRDTRNWIELTRYLADDRNLEVAKDGGPSPAIAAAAKEIGALPRVGVYAPWSASIDEGWLRWTLEYLGIPYQRVRNSMVKAGSLRDDFDVLLIPDVRTSTLKAGRREYSIESSLSGGLGAEGMVAIEEFVDGGGKLIVMESACPWVIDLFRLPLIDVTSEAKNSKFSCSGSVVRGILADQELTDDMPQAVPLMFSHSKAWRSPTDKEKGDRTDADCQVESFMHYAPRALLLSGAITQPEAIQGHIAWAKVEREKGTIHLFGFRPYYRGWTHASFHLLLRAILVD